MTTGLSWLDRKPRGYFSTPSAPPPPRKAEMPAKRTSAPKAAQQPIRPPGPVPTTQHRAGNPSPAPKRRETRAQAEGAAWAGLVDIEALVDRLTEQSGDRQAAEIMRPFMPAMLRAMLAGAAVPGPSGAADRAALAKIIGAPWAMTAADRKGGATGKTRDAGKAVGGRLEAALARKERALGAGSVTQDAAEGEEPSSDGLFGE